MHERQFCFKVRVLGTTRIERAGRLLDLDGSFDSYALFCLLASRLGRPIPVAAVVRTLWAGAGDKVGYERLLTSIARVSQCFGAEPGSCPVAIEGESVRLNLSEAVWLDATELVEATKSSDTLRRMRALGLYRGEPFADFPHDSWAMLPREHLRDVYVTLAREEAERSIAEDNLLRAADLLAAALDTDPFGEELYTAAMAVNVELGRVSVAVRQARRCRNTLADLGLAPSAVFEEMERQLAPHRAAVPNRFV